jgi:preprotein translocase subunit SecD
MDTIASQLSTLSTKEVALSFSPLFIDYNTQEFRRIIIDTSEFVPLELDKLPITEQQTEQKKKLLLSLTKEAGNKLKTFSSNHLMRKVALVIGGEVYTLHKIKVPITNGQLQISRCNDNACELLNVKLKDNVIK